MVPLYTKLIYFHKFFFDPVKDALFFWWIIITMIMNMTYQASFGDSSVISSIIEVFILFETFSS